MRIKNKDIFKIDGCVLEKERPQGIWKWADGCNCSNFNARIKGTDENATWWFPPNRVRVNDIYLFSSYKAYCLRGLPGKMNLLEVK